MNLLHYPKTLHARQLQPRQFKRYRSYKKYLQYEFYRICVYCREPDTSHRSAIYGVDHYRPMGLAKFAHLNCEYTNLYYCCQACNSRKNDYWPASEKTDPHIVNPCDFRMAEHLKFNSTTFEVEWASIHGAFTTEQLQLNEEASVEARRLLFTTVKQLEQLKIANELQLKTLAEIFNKGNISLTQYQNEVALINQDIVEVSKNINILTGNKPVKIRKNLNGLNLLLNP